MTTCEPLEFGDIFITLGPGILILLLVGSLASTHVGNDDSRVGGFATIVAFQLLYLLLGNVDGFYETDLFVDSFEGSGVSTSDFGQTADDLYDAHPWFDGITVGLALASVALPNFQVPSIVWTLVILFVGGVHLIGTMANNLISVPIVIGALIASNSFNRVGKAIEGATNSVLPSAAKVSEALTHQGIGFVLLVIAVVSEGDMVAVFTEPRVWYAFASFVAFILADRVGDGKTEARVLSLAGIGFGALNIYATNKTVQDGIHGDAVATTCEDTMWQAVFTYMGDLSVMELLELVTSVFIASAIAMSAIDGVTNIAPNYIRGMAGTERDHNDCSDSDSDSDEESRKKPKNPSTKQPCPPKPCVIKPPRMTLP